LSDAKSHTETLVKKYWKSIDVVARSLIEREVLTGDELVKLVNDIQLDYIPSTEIYPSIL
jgi:hypothetical protein